MRNNPASRKLYNALAADLLIVNRSLSDAERRGFIAAVDTVADALKRDNPRFDKERFMNAAIFNIGRARKNPPSLVTFGNPAFCLSKNVVEIKYQHAGDGHYYRHEFRPKQVQIVVDGPGAKVAFLRRVDGKPLIEDY